ncbi:hypothetical protein KIPB_003675 [Kipferlia bialata]|uniref:Tetratricopeptide repeat protein 5 OB fold domain-containing protein n=1 Tax=Kipferlia bialata TaxID=797122 RepID=A0A9K3CVT4_9EUKA|nr:hypothetical protein KIPB_003675 [Kipferlia bialata]|eukprot:g3675.t1
MAPKDMLARAQGLMDDLENYDRYSFPPTAAQKKRHIESLVQGIQATLDKAGADMEPENKGWYYTLLGSCLYHVERVELAVACLLKAVKLLPSSVPAWHWLGKSYMMSGQWTSAEVALSRAKQAALSGNRSMNPTLLRQCLCTLSYLFRTRPSSTVNLTRAVGYARSAVECEMDSPEAWENLGVSLLKRALLHPSSAMPGDIIGARVALRNAIERTGERNCPDAWCNLGALEELLLEFQSAYDAYKTAFEQDPTLERARVGARSIRDTLFEANRIAQRAYEHLQGRRRSAMPHPSGLIEQYTSGPSGEEKTVTLRVVQVVAGPPTVPTVCVVSTPQRSVGILCLVQSPPTLASGVQIKVRGPTVSTLSFGAGAESIHLLVFGVKESPLSCMTVSGRRITGELLGPGIMKDSLKV